MKRLLMIAFYAVAIISMVMAQDDLIMKVDQQGKVGFVDKKGTVVFNYIFTGAFPFSKGYAQVFKEEKTGFINTHGAVTVPIIYDNIELWSDNIYKVKIKTSFGLLKADGTIVLPVKYSNISAPNIYGKAWIALGGKVVTGTDKKNVIAGCKYGIIDNSGNILIQPEYKGLFEFARKWKFNEIPYGEALSPLWGQKATSDTLLSNCEYMSFSKDPNSCLNGGLLNNKGEELIKMGVYSFIVKPQSDMVRYYIWGSKQTQCGYYNLITKKDFLATTINQYINDIKFITHMDYLGNITPVNNNGQSWSIIDKSGNTINSGVESVTKGEISKAWAFCKNDTWKAYNWQGEKILGDKNYEGIIFPLTEDNKDVYVIKENGKWGTVDKEGKQLIPCTYEQASAPSYGWIIVKKDGKYGVIDINNKSIIPREYENIISNTYKYPDCMWVMKDSLWYNYNIVSQSISEDGYKVVVSNFDNGYSLVQPNNMTVGETVLSRSMLELPSLNIGKDDKFNNSQNAFGFVIGKDNKQYISLPVTMNLYEKVVEYIKKNNNQPLDQSQSRRLLLSLTKKSRSYPLTDKITDDNWDY